MTTAKSILSILGVCVFLLISFSTPDDALALDINQVFELSKKSVVVILNERKDPPSKPGDNKDNRNSKEFYIYRDNRPNPVIAKPPLHTYLVRENNGNVVMWSVGTGFVFKKDGLIITNYHVVRDSKKLLVESYDGQIFNAEILGFDDRPDYDIAVLKIDNNNNLPMLPLLPIDTEEIIRPGQAEGVYIGKKLLIIGHPYLYKYTASEATVSNLGYGPQLDYIQIDSSILPGNSGSPLINNYGEVVGVLYAAIDDSSTHGIATPMKKMLEVIAAVLKPR